LKDIDRVAPAVRPDRTAVIHQRWAELRFLHWPVPVSALRALGPRALTIDTHEGTACVGLVPGRRKCVTSRTRCRRRARVDMARETLVAAAGIARPDTPPPLVHYARAVDVEIFALRAV
jgi:uncharacterized protein YqjF (DUF2071 family)